MTKEAAGKPRVAQGLPYIIPDIFGTTGTTDLQMENNTVSHLEFQSQAHEPTSERLTLFCPLM